MFHFSFLETFNAISCIVCQTLLCKQRLILFHLGLDLARPLNAINSNFFQLKPETDLDSTFDQLPAENPISVEEFWSGIIFSIFTLH